MYRLGWVFIPLVLLTLVSGVYAAAEHSASRIELYDRTVFSDVTFTIDTVDQVIRISSSGAQRAVAYGDIALIRDSNGNDVTLDVLAEHFSPPPQPGPKRTSNTPAIRKIRYAILPNIGFPTDDFYHYYKSAPGLGAEISFPVNDWFAIRVEAARVGLTKRFDHTGDTMQYPPLIYLSDDNISMTAWRLSMETEFFYWPEHHRSVGTLIYGFSGIGLIYHRTSGVRVYSDASDAIVGTISKSESYGRFLLNVGAGMMRPISSHVGLSLGTEADVIFYNATSYYLPSKFKLGLLMNLKFGVVIF